MELICYYKEQYCEKGFRKYSELILCFLVVIEQHNELLIKKIKNEA